MKVKWRHHELVAVSLMATAAIGSYLSRMYNLPAGQTETYYARPLVSLTGSFSYIYNILLPQIGSVLLLYLTYVCTSSIVAWLARQIQQKKTRTSLLLSSGVLLLVLVVAAYVLALGINIASYYSRPHLFSYNGFGILALFGYNDTPLINIFSGLDRALALVGLYLIWSIIREAIIYFIEKPGSAREYRVLITNQATTWILVYLALAAYIIAFQLVNEDLLIAYFTFIPLAFLVYLTNTYKLFPSFENVSANIHLNGQKAGVINNKLILKVLLYTCVYTLLFALLYVKATYTDNFYVIFFGWWAIQLFVVTPLSWVYYRQQKDKILQLRGVEKELIKSTAHLQFLRSQINPHFLFNALNTLYGTALLENSERTAEGIQKLGDMMRFMLHENTQDFIPVSREVEYLNNYIALQKLRTGPSPHILIEDTISAQNCHYQIAPMLLIPLVENAFKHGIRQKEKSWIRITLACTEQHISFEVRNSVHTSQANDPEKDKSGIGLKNVTERLMLLYPGRHQLNVQESAKEFVVQLTIRPTILASAANVVAK